MLTDDGALLHRITSPRSHLPRTYRAVLASPLDSTAAELFASGTLRLSGEAKLLAPARAQCLSAQDVRLTVAEGRYHQVRRMFAAVGNHVVSLHRESLGPFVLEGLDAGAWRVLSDAERVRLDQALTTARATSGLPPAP